MDTLQAVKQIQEVGKKNSERISSQKTRMVTKYIKCFRQGDLYIFRVPDNWPVGNELKRDKIADGVSLGSTHILLGKFKVYEGVKVPTGINSLNARAGLGYAFDAEDNTVLTHQEHDHFCFVDGGRFQVLHQVDSRTLQKVKD